MKPNLPISFIWIPCELGGHRADPYTGMRLEIRWQKHLEAHLKCARDVECTVLAFDPQTSLGTAVCELSSGEPVPPEWSRGGELIELLNGFRVLAVGKIVDDGEIGTETT